MYLHRKQLEHHSTTQKNQNTKNIRLSVCVSMVWPKAEILDGDTNVRFRIDLEVFFWPITTCHMPSARWIRLGTPGKTHC